MANISHLPCPYVDCGSSDAFSFETAGYGKCHSCSRSYPSKAKVFDWAAEEYPTKSSEPKDMKPVRGTYEGIRGLDPDVAELFGINRQFNTAGEWILDAFKYPTNVKYRDTTPAGEKKKIWLKDKGSLLDLFGPEFNAGSSKRLYITEGEYDAASLYQILGKTYPVKSLPSSSIGGAYGDKFLAHNHSYLNSFEELVYAGELDKVGQATAERLYQAYPSKFFFVPMSKHKDANDFLTSGDSNDLMWAARKPQRYTPDNFFCSDSDVEKAITEENPYEYVPTGIFEFDDKLRGLVKGGVTFIKAPRGAGKTSLIRMFEIGLLKNSDCKIALLHAEEQKSTTYRGMATYHLGVNVNTKDDAKNNGVSEEEVIAAAKEVTQGDRTILFEMRASDEPTRVLDYIRTAVSIYGAEYVFIDHIQRLAYMSSAGVDGATAMLTSIGAQAAQLAKEYNVGLIFISQVNDDGRTKYASALEEEAIVCIKVQRDTENEDETIRNTTELIADKNRPFSKLGPVGSLYYDSETSIMQEVNYSDV